MMETYAEYGAIGVIVSLFINDYKSYEKSKNTK